MATPLPVARRHNPGLRHGPRHGRTRDQLDDEAEDPGIDPRSKMVKDELLSAVERKGSS